MPDARTHRLDQFRPLLWDDVPEGGATDQILLAGQLTHVAAAHPRRILEHPLPERRAQPPRQFLMVTGPPGRRRGDFQAPVGARANPRPLDGHGPNRVWNRNGRVPPRGMP